MTSDTRTQSFIQKRRRWIDWVVKDVNGKVPQLNYWWVVYWLSYNRIRSTWALLAPTITVRSHSLLVFYWCFVYVFRINVTISFILLNLTGVSTSVHQLPLLKCQLFNWKSANKYNAMHALIDFLIFCSIIVWMTNHNNTLTHLAHLIFLCSEFQLKFHTNNLEISSIIMIDNSFGVSTGILFN